MRLRSQAERELRRLGHRIHRRTNSQIASELFLSRRTVETHIRNISRKLDVSSRAEIAKAVERADREAEPEARAGQP